PPSMSPLCTPPTSPLFPTRRSSDLSFIPGLKVMAPSTPAEASSMLRAAVPDDDPVLFLENLGLYNTKGEVADDYAEPENDDIATSGRAAVTREGSDVTLIGYSRMAVTAHQVAERLAEEDISVDVVDLRSLRPLDRQT